MNRRDLFRCSYIVAGLRLWPGATPDAGDLTLLALVLAAVLDGDVYGAMLFARGLARRRRAALEVAA